jgi:RNA polymerase sigma-70 factor (ECF subfamily)
MAESASGSDVFRLTRYREYLRALAGARLEQRPGAGVDPSEVVQEALLKAHQARHQFRGETEQQLAAWLRTILNNTLANMLRDNSRRHERGFPYANDAAESSATGAADLPADPGLPPEELAANNEQLLRLASALEHLPEDQRAVVEMKHLHGLSVAEICERLDRSKPAVVGLLYRGLKTLRKLLDEANANGARDPS